jgi:hypothetical protein
MPFLNRCIWTAASSGTGSFVVSAAALNGYAPASCTNPTAKDQATYHYWAFYGTQVEEGDGVWSNATSTLTRTPNVNGSSLVNFTGPPIVFMGGPTANDVMFVATQNMTWYVDEVAGNDSNSGLSSGTVTTTAGTSASSPTITCGSVPSFVAANMSVWDTTTNKYVGIVSTTGVGTITLTGNAQSVVGSGDVLAFANAKQTVQAAVDAAAKVNWDFKYYPEILIGNGGYTALTGKPLLTLPNLFNLPPPTSAQSGSSAAIIGNNSAVGTGTTNATTSTSSATLSFASVPAFVAAGMVVMDTTTNQYVGVVLSTGAGVVTLVANARTAVGNGDTLSFSWQVTLTDNGTQYLIQDTPNCSWYLSGFNFAGTYGAINKSGPNSVIWLGTCTVSGNFQQNVFSCQAGGGAILGGYGGTLTVTSTAIGTNTSFTYLFFVREFLLFDGADIIFANPVTMGQLIGCDDQYSAFYLDGGKFTNGANVSCWGDALVLANWARFETSGSTTTVDGATLTRANFPGGAGGSQIYVDATSTFEADLTPYYGFPLTTAGVIPFLDASGTLYADYGHSNAGEWTFTGLLSAQTSLTSWAAIGAYNFSAGGHGFLIGTIGSAGLFGLPVGSHAYLDYTSGNIPWWIDTSSNLGLWGGLMWGPSSNGSFAVPTKDTGIFRTAAGTLAIGNGAAGNASGTLDLAILTVTSEVNFGGTAAADPLLGKDSTITGAALALVGNTATNPTAFNAYNTYSNSTNYENAIFDWLTTANVLTIGTQKGSGGGSARAFQFSYGGTIVGDFAKTAANTWTFSAAVTLAAGTASIAPLTLTSGTNLTAAVAGVVEFDGKAFYATSVASSRQVIATEQVINQSGTRTFANNTSAQAIFNATTNGAITLAGSTTYEFEMELDITGLSTSTHSINLGFALGGSASITSMAYSFLVGTQATPATPTAPAYMGWITSNSATAITATGITTANSLIAKIRGTIRMNVGGTVTPQITQVTNSAAAVLQANSFARFWPIGSNTVTNVGDWS